MRIHKMITGGEMLLIFYQILLTRFLNPLSPNSDQHQFSPDNIHTL